MARKRSRNWMSAGMVALIAAVMLYAFWPRPMSVDMGKVEVKPMMMTIDEEARTRVRNSYVVSAPIDGRLLRIEVTAGDEVEGGTTVIARMLPIHPPPLNIRTREQARAEVAAARAALAAARASFDKAMALKDHAEAELKRKRDLTKKGIAAKAVFDEAERVWRAASANLDVAKATIAMRQADLANAQANFISFGGASDPSQGVRPSNLGMSDSANTIPITAPITGRILRVIQESETIVTAGTPILEIGDTSNDLEVVTELLSTDAVQVSPGDKVIIRKWGGSERLRGLVKRVEPWGFTKTSALGVEEQRVNTIIKFTDPPTQRPSLGHGYRVETQIVIWQSKATLTVPSSALFRKGNEWAAFQVVDGTARLTPVDIGHNNGTLAEVLKGLKAGDMVVLYPGPSLADGGRVTRRDIE
jgi:HlyD family secretion protein